MHLDSLIQHLGLSPHPEGGFYRETFRSDVEVAGPGGAPRAALTQILYALPSGGTSAWHRVASDEIWQHQGGDPLDLLVISAAGLQRVRLGAVTAGHAPQGFVPAGAWQAAQVPAGEVGWSLCGCSVAPGFDFDDFEMIDDDGLVELLRSLDDPREREQVRALARSR